MAHASREYSLSERKVQLTCPFANTVIIVVCPFRARLRRPGVLKHPVAAQPVILRTCQPVSAGLSAGPRATDDAGPQAFNVAHRWRAASPFAGQRGNSMAHSLRNKVLRVSLFTHRISAEQPGGHLLRPVPGLATDPLLSAPGTRARKRSPGPGKPAHLRPGRGDPRCLGR